MIYDGLELRQTALDSSMWPLFFCQRLILSWACLQGGRVLKTQLSRDSGGPALNWHYHFCHILSQRKWQNQSRFKAKKKKRFLLFKEKDAKPYLTLYMDAGRERIGTLSTNNLSQHVGFKENRFTAMTVHVVINCWWKGSQFFPSLHPYIVLNMALHLSP